MHDVRNQLATLVYIIFVFHLDIAWGWKEERGSEEGVDKSRAEEGEIGEGEGEEQVIRERGLGLGVYSPFYYKLGNNASQNSERYSLKT